MKPPVDELATHPVDHRAVRPASITPPDARPSRLPWFKLRESEDEEDERDEEIAELRQKLETALRVCEDAGVTEQEIELAMVHADPVSAILRLKGIY